jgi:hypothetical protein
MKRSRGVARRAASNAPASEPAARTEPSTPYSLAPSPNSSVAMSALVIWKFIPAPPRKNTHHITRTRSGRDRR